MQGALVYGRVSSVGLSCAHSDTRPRKKPKPEEPSESRFPREKTEAPASTMRIAQRSNLGTQKEAGYREGGGCKHSYEAALKHSYTRKRPTVESEAPTRSRPPPEPSGNPAPTSLNLRARKAVEARQGATLREKRSYDTHSQGTSRSF